MFELFSISKVFTGIGLLLDLVGVIMLLYIEIKYREKDILGEDSLKKKSYVDVYKASKEGVKLDKTSEDKEIEKILIKLPIQKAQKLSKSALCLMIFGFLLQIISLFIDN